MREIDTLVPPAAMLQRRIQESQRVMMQQATVMFALDSVGKQINGEVEQMIPAEGYRYLVPVSLLEKVSEVPLMSDIDALPKSERLRARTRAVESLFNIAVQTVIDDPERSNAEHNVARSIRSIGAAVIAAAQAEKAFGIDAGTRELNSRLGRGLKKMIVSSHYASFAPLSHHPWVQEIQSYEATHDTKIVDVSMGDIAIFMWITETL